MMCKLILCSGALQLSSLAFVCGDNCFQIGERFGSKSALQTHGTLAAAVLWVMQRPK